MGSLGFFFSCTLGFKLVFQKIFEKSWDKAASEVICTYAKICT